MRLVAIDSAVRYNYFLCRGKETSIGVIVAVGAPLGKPISEVCRKCTKQYIRKKRVELELRAALSSPPRSICIFDGLPQSFYAEFEPPICYRDVFVVKAPVRGCIRYGVYSICHDGDVKGNAIVVDGVHITFEKIVALNALAHTLANKYANGIWYNETYGCLSAVGTHPHYDEYTSLY